MNEHFERINRLLEPYRKIEKIMAPTLKYTKTVSKFQSRIPSYVTEMHKSLERINSFNNVPKINDTISRHIENHRKVAERIKEFYRRTPEHLLLIAKNGWFLELESELNLPSDIADMLKDGETKNVDSELSKYYEEELQRIFDELIQRHPNRKTIFNEILKSYKLGLYNTTIPTIFTQVDGVCYDSTNIVFFKKQGKQHLPKIRLELENISGIFFKIYLSPLQNQIPISVHEDYLDDYPCTFNRHRIIHGNDTNYGTKINCLKSISLLKYVSDLLHDFEEHKNKPS